MGIEPITIRFNYKMFTRHFPVNAVCLPDVKFACTTTLFFSMTSRVMTRTNSNRRFIEAIFVVYD